MTPKQQRFEDNMARFADPELKGDGKTLNIGGQRDELLNQAVLDALDDLDNLDEEFAQAYERFAWTEEEMEKARK